MTDYPKDVREYYEASDVPEPESVLQKYIASLEGRMDGAPGVLAMANSRSELVMAREMAEDLTKYPKALDLLISGGHVELALRFYRDYRALERLRTVNTEEMLRHLSDDTPRELEPKSKFYDKSDLINKKFIEHQPYSTRKEIIAGIVDSLRIKQDELPPYLKHVEAWFRLRSKD